MISSMALDGSLVHGPEVSALVVPAPLVPVDTLLGLDLPGEATLWSDHDAGRWSFAGRGHAARVTAHGAERFEATRRGIDALLTSYREVGSAAGVVAPVMLGGFAFREGAAGEGPWRGFGDATFSIPRWLYARCGDAAFLRVSWRRGDGVGEPHPSEIERVLTALGAAPTGAPADVSHELVVEPTPFADYQALVDAALVALREGQFSKVVTAQRSRVRAAHAIDVLAALRRLRAAQSACVVFAFERNGATFLGASPERLVTLSGRGVETEAVAGSIARKAGDDGAQQRLLDSDKERREHDSVREGILEALAPLCDELGADPVKVRALASIYHLVTPIRARVTRTRNVLDLVAALHPTPAVAGAPREASLAWMNAHEPFQRGYYASPVGFVDAAGQGSFSVALRSAVVSDNEAFVYGGGGVVEGSDARAEHAEAVLKQRAVLTALGAIV